MNIRTLLGSVFLLSLPVLIAYSIPQSPIPQIPEVDELTTATLKPKPHLKPFTSDSDLKAYFKQINDERNRKRSTQAESANAATADVTASEASPADEQKAGKNDEDSVTNTQHAGVDEGGIVKVHGDHLVILRRGRLFTVKIGGDSLAPVSAVNAYAPNIDPRNDWYDEMLIYKNTVVVIGYSYGRGGTEINLFDLNNGGELGYRSTYHLRSNDYYSSRNYASRLIGGKLIFYTPQYLGYHGDPSERFPALRRWSGQGNNRRDGFENIIAPTRIYRAESLEASSYNTALHTVTVCDLDLRELSCNATGVLGAPGRVFYVSPKSVYVWTTEWQYRSPQRPEAKSMLYSLPLDGSAPSAIGVAGAPIDQFSFLEGSDAHLNVLVRAQGYGEQMWGSETPVGTLALLRLPISEFADGSVSASPSRYRRLPSTEGYAVQNRFVGDHVLYGDGTGWGRPTEGTKRKLYAVNYALGDTSELELDHGVDRIEALGNNAVAVGSNGKDLYFTPVRLASEPRLERPYVRRNASQGETRSHGFFYRSQDDNSGYLGLPIARGGRPGYRHLVEDSAAVIFLRNDGLEFLELGELGSKGSADPNDGCRASCVDWYGNARPLFIKDRIFALMGYELVEGHLVHGNIYSKRRINFSPGRSERSNSE